MRTGGVALLEEWVLERAETEFMEPLGQNLQGQSRVDAACGRLLSLEYENE